MPFFLKSWKPRKGFTLAELLIVLALIGVIATFVIPKIIVSYQNQQNIAKTKEAVAMISAAFQAAQAAGAISPSSRPADLTPYMNYVNLDISGTVIDAEPTFASTACGVPSPCIKLHNGGYLWFSNGFTFNSNAAAGYGGLVEFRFDPDYLNNTTSTADGPLKAVRFDLYYDGFLTTRGQVRPGSGYGGPSTIDPSWFIW